MANEPERPIEKLLRAAAQKHRDDAGPPFELHPADRRLLQNEVARKFAKSQRESRSFAEVLGQLWPRFAGGIAILAVLGLAVWVLLPVPRDDKPETFLARNLPASKDMLAKEPLPAATPAPATVAPPAAPTAKAEPAMVAYADTTPSARTDAARQLGEMPSPVAEGSTAAQFRRQDAEKLALAAALKPADRQEPAMTLPTTPRETPAQASAVVANAALERRYGLAGQPAPTTSLPAAPAAPPTVAMAPTTANVPLAEESAKPVGAPSRQPADARGAAADALAQLADDKSSQQGTYYRPSAAVASANRPNPSPLARNSLSKAAPEALQEAKALSVAQRFVQVPSEVKAKDALAVREAASPAVLASFQVEQAGQVLRITDGDGSIYTGSLELANAARRTRAARADAPAATFAARAPARALEQETASSLDSDAPAQKTYAFRVVGTNRSLQENVVFTGNLLTTTNLILSLRSVSNFSIGGALGKADRQEAFSYRATNLGTGGDLGASPIVTAQPGFLPLLNSRISGKVVVGSGKPVEINALPASP
jgi:hypothetical protein